MPTLTSREAITSKHERMRRWDGGPRLDVTKSDEGRVFATQTSQAASPGPYRPEPCVVMAELQRSTKAGARTPATQGSANRTAGFWRLLHEGRAQTSATLLSLSGASAGTDGAGTDCAQTGRKATGVDLATVTNPLSPPRSSLKREEIKPATIWATRLSRTAPLPCVSDRLDPLPPRASNPPCPPLRIFCSPVNSFTMRIREDLGSCRSSYRKRAATEGAKRTLSGGI